MKRVEGEPTPEEVAAALGAVHLLLDEGVRHDQQPKAEVWALAGRLEAQGRHADRESVSRLQ